MQGLSPASPEEASHRESHSHEDGNAADGRRGQAEDPQVPAGTPAVAEGDHGRGRPWAEGTRTADPWGANERVSF